MGAQEKMPLPEDVTGDIEEVASGWAAVGKAVMNTQVAADHTDGVPGWIGAAADAYTGAIKKLGGHARTLGGSFAPAVTALHTWEAALKTMITTTVPEFWRRHDDAVDVYNRGIAALNDEIEAARQSGEVYPQDVIDQRESSLVSTLKETWDGIISEYLVAMDGLDTNANDAASKIQGVLDSIVDPAKQDSRDKIGASLFDDIPLVDGQAEWEQAQHMAPEMANAMKDPDLTPEKLKAFHEKYGSLLSNPFMANALAEKISPQQMVEFGLRASSAGMSIGNPQLGDEVNRQVGAAIVLATGGMNPDQVNAHDQACFETVRKGLVTDEGHSIPEQTRNFAEDLKKAGRATYNPWELSKSSVPYNVPVEGYDILSQLIGEAGRANPNLALGPGFFDVPDGGRSIAQDMVAWDAEKRVRNIDAYSDAVSIFASDNKMCDPTHAMYTLMDRPESLDSNGDLDPVLKAADRSRLDSVQNFLNSDTSAGMVDTNQDGIIDGRDESVNMTRYLTGGRSPAIPPSMYYGFQDGGEQFGKVIQQASVPEPYDPDNYDEWRPRDKRATNIAANFMFGYQDGLDIQHYQNDQIDGQDVFGYRNPRLRSWAGLIMAPHLEGITASMGDGSMPETGVGGGVNDNHWITLGSEMQHRLLGKNGFFTDLAFDNPAVNDNGTPYDHSDDYYEGGRAPALDNLMVQAQREYGQTLHEAVAGRGNLSVKNVADRWAPLLEALFTAPADANGQVQAAIRAHNESWQKLLSAGIGAIPFGGIVKDATAEYFIDQVKSNGTAPTLEAFFPTGDIDEKSLVDKKDLVKEYMTNALYQEITEQGDFSGAAQSPQEYSLKIENEKQKFVRESDNSLMSYSEMSPAARKQFRLYLLEMGSGLKNSGDFMEIRDAVERATTLHGDARTLTE